MQLVSSQYFEKSSLCANGRHPGLLSFGAPSGGRFARRRFIVEEKMNAYRKPNPVFSVVVTVLCLMLMTLSAAAQSIVSGDVTGTVTDPSGAVISGATVTLKNVDTNATQTTSTNANGFYRFSLLKPGRYVVTLSQPGFQTVNQPAYVAVGQATTANIRLSVGQSSQTVEVTAESPVIQTENGNISTSFDARAIEALPNPGGDTSYIAQTAPGVAPNASGSGGYGNFSAFGLPATSNLFTTNGNDSMDPYLNLNNSGATNLSLGANELSEATVVSNGYSGNYGRQAGAQVNYTTKSGSNQFHGNASYWWNGRLLNANSWFNNNAGVDRPFVNANQWAASLGGPIVKDKLFFFVNTEGLRVVLPTSQAVFTPTPAFANYVLTQGLPANGAVNSGPLFQSMFQQYANAPGAANATPVAPVGGVQADCESVPTPANPGAAAAVGVTLPVYTGGPCLQTFRSTAGNFTHEWILSGRLDFNPTNNDKIFARVRTDHGVQASYTDPINPVNNAVSTQPQYEGQLNYNHVFSPNVVNQFIMSGSWYSALFSNPNRNGALQAFPTSLIPNTLTGLGGENYLWPQGRNVTQYQFVDDLSTTKGNHTLKFGVNYRRNDISDYAFGVLTSGEAFIDDLAFLAAGQSDFFAVRVPQQQVQPVALYSLGVYGQDQWRITKNFRIDASLRADHNSNPVCQTNCFARLTSNEFANLNHDPNAPYNTAIQSGLHQAFPSTDALLWQPRLGFAWSPLGNDKTVVRGGAGIFYDLFPGILLDRFARNSPYVNSFSLAGFISPAEPNNVFAQAQAYNNLLVNGFANGATLASIQGQAAAAGLPTFRGVNLNTVTGDFHTPQFQEWNLEIEQALGNKSSISLNYVGNHGIHIPMLNGFPNSFVPTGFVGLPTTAPDPRFRSVTELTNAGVSNYNGLTVSFQRKYSQFQFQANYTYSHALDNVSNGGVDPYNLNDSVTFQIDPTNPKSLNYSNADYDMRHLFTLNYSWSPAYKFSNGFLSQTLGGWTLSGTLFAHSGTPWTAYWGNVTSLIGNAASGILTGTLVQPGAGGNCDRPHFDATGTDTGCLNAGQFVDVTAAGPTGIGNTRRNQFRGPAFFDTDMSLMKNFKLTERVGFAVGANAFNLFNHPNFANPVGNLASSSFGQIQQTVSPPTTPLGAFLSSDASFRIIQLNARITF